MRTESPQTYLKVAASLVPKQMELNERRQTRRLCDFTDELLAIIMATENN